MSKLFVNETAPSYLCDDYTRYMFAKIVDNTNYINYMLDGKLFMRNTKMFHGTGNGRNDDFESANVIAIADDEHLQQQQIVEIGGEFWMCSVPYSKKDDAYLENQAFIAHSNVNTNVFCMYSLFIDTQNAKAQSIDDKARKEFGEYCVIIKNPYELYKRIDAALPKYNNIIAARAGFVKYIPYNKRDNVQQWHDFCKFEDWYRHQNEFRFVFKNKKNEILEFDLECSLRDIAIPIKTETFISELKSGKAFVISDNNIKLSEKIITQSNELLTKI